MKYSITTFVIAAVGGVAIVAVLIYIAIVATRPPRKLPGAWLVTKANVLPLPATWNYEDYVESVPARGKIGSDIVPGALMLHMQRIGRGTINENYPPARRDELNAAEIGARRPVSWLPASVTRIVLKWGVLRVKTQSRPSLIYKDLMGRSTESGKIALSNWNWESPAPAGPKDRHAGGLDAVDIAHFGAAPCDIFVVGSGVKSAIQVSFENFHAIRQQVKTSDGGRPIVLVADSLLCVGILNELLAAGYTKNLCFLIHSTC